MAPSEISRGLPRSGSRNRPGTPARVPKPISSASSKANARAIAALAHAARHRAPNRMDRAAQPPARRSAPNPLWVIAIAMAAFFGATALIMMFD